MEYINIGSIRASRFILGSNPFSGFSHQGSEKDIEMMDYYTSERIKKVWMHAEKLGINTCIARADNHIIRLLREYWNEGGKIQWIAQVSNDIQGSMSVGLDYAVKAGAKGCFLHGGVMDFMLEKKKIHEIKPLISKIKPLFIFLSK